MVEELTNEEILNNILYKCAKCNELEEVNKKLVSYMYKSLKALEGSGYQACACGESIDIVLKGFEEMGLLTHDEQGRRNWNPIIEDNFDNRREDDIS